MNRRDMKLFLDYYNGDREAIFKDFTVRRVAEGLPREQRISIRDFYFQNDIRVIQDTRANFMPPSFDVVVTRKGDTAPHDGLTREVKMWLCSRNFGGGRTFWEALPGYYLAQENYGTLFLKLFVKGGEVSVQKMYSQDVEAVTDENNYLEVKKYVFNWEEAAALEGGGVRISQMREEIDAKGFSFYMDGRLVKKEAHAFGFIPVIRILREEVEGSPYGRSGIQDLVEGQLAVNMALTKRAWATKYNSFRVWAPKESGHVEPGTTITISPGALSPIPLEAVGGDVDLSAVERELQDALDHLYRLGCVPRKLREEIASSATSAKALNTLLQGLKRYTEKKLVYLRRGFEELIEKFLTVKFGTGLFAAAVSFPSLSGEDPQHVLARAQFLADRGFVTEALGELGYDEQMVQQMQARQSV
ncbi:MAG: hypothetical protein JW765_09935 [Deltaproteobacteria bacterium]|nr:hypothetical protein [Candidatus Zymogenaceae bacterium]